MLLDGRRRPAERMLALGVVDEVAPADALSHALGIGAADRARRVHRGAVVAADRRGERWRSPTSSAIPRSSGCSPTTRACPARLRPARSSTLVRLGFTQGIVAGLAAEAREFGRLVASDEGRAGIDRFLARRSWPLPLRHDDR